MTAAHKLSDSAPNTDALIASAVNALIAGSGLRKDEVAAAVGISKANFYVKLSAARPWKASEVAALAAYFSVSVEDLFNGLGGLFAGWPGRGEVSAPVQDASGWPGPGSNRRPFTFQANARTN